MPRIFSESLDGDGRADLAGQCRVPGKIFRPLRDAGQRTVSVVDFEGQHDRLSFKQQDRAISSLTMEWSVVFSSR